MSRENNIKKKIGRPPTDRQPLMVRVEKKMIFRLEAERRKTGRKSVPSLIRWMIYKHFGEAHDRA